MDLILRNKRSLIQETENLIQQKSGQGQGDHAKHGIDHNQLAKLVVDKSHCYYRFDQSFFFFNILNNVFKSESVTRGVFMFVRRGVSLKALRRKLFVITYNLINIL